MLINWAELSICSETKCLVQLSWVYKFCYLVTWCSMFSLPLLLVSFVSCYLTCAIFLCSCAFSAIGVMAVLPAHWYYRIVVFVVVFSADKSETWVCLCSMEFNYVYWRQRAWTHSAAVCSPGSKPVFYAFVTYKKFLKNWNLHTLYDR